MATKNEFTKIKFRFKVGDIVFKPPMHGTDVVYSHNIGALPQFKIKQRRYYEEINGHGMITYTCVNNSHSDVSNKNIVFDEDSLMLVEDYKVKKEIIKSTEKKSESLNLAASQMRQVSNPMTFGQAIQKYYNATYDKKPNAFQDLKNVSPN